MGILFPPAALSILGLPRYGNLIKKIFFWSCPIRDINVFNVPLTSLDFPGSDGKSICLQCGRPRFDPWVGKIPWRRKWHPTPVFLPGESHRRRSLVGCSPRGHKESDTTSLSLSQLPDSYSYPCVTCEETFRS